MDDATIAKFQQEIGKMGYKFQFVTLAGFHSLNHAMFELSAGYAKRGMAAYSELQQLEFASESKGYTCSKHQREVHVLLLRLAQCTSNSCVCPAFYCCDYSFTFALLCITLFSGHGAICGHVCDMWSYVWSPP